MEETVLPLFTLHSWPYSLFFACLLNYYILYYDIFKATLNRVCYVIFLHRIAVLMTKTRLERGIR